MQVHPGRTVASESEDGGGATRLGGRLGLNVPAAWWPTAPTVKAFEAAGFAWVQVHSPPIEVLRDRERSAAHAAALAGALETSGLALVVHAPDELSVGTPGHDRAMTGLMHYAARAGAELVVYHGLNFAPRRSLPLRDLDRAWLEERSLERFAALAQQLEIVIAIENLAPVYPSRPRLSHDAAAVRDLVVRLCSPWIRTCLDLGHAHVTAERAGLDLRAVVEPLLEPVALFHVHDNLGARTRDERVPGTDPLRLDLHLAPGAGTLPWEAVGDLLLGHPAPLLLEVHPPHRPEPLSLARVTAALFEAIHARDA
jgi:sugar phosphate isomerase/epimerase